MRITGRQSHGFVRKILLSAIELRKIFQLCAKRFIEVIKMVKLHSASMFIKDPKDVWGREKSIGLAELATRLGAVKSYDYGGNVIIEDDFSSSITDWTKSGSAGGLMSRSNSLKDSGDFSMKLTTPAVAGDTVSVFRSIAQPPTTTSVGVETMFTKDDDHRYIDIGMYIYDGTYRYNGIIRIDVQNSKLQYRNTSNTWTDFATSVDISELGVSGMPIFHHAKLVIDLANKKYARFILDSIEYDISDYSFYYTASAIGRQFTIYMEYHSHLASAKVSYVDSVIVTRNEQI